MPSDDHDEAVDLTRYLKLLAGAHGMDRRDVADVVTRGGVPCTASRVDKWLRSPDAVKAGSGYAKGETKRRGGDISPAEFEAFCVGLRGWLDEPDA